MKLSKIKIGERGVENPPSIKDKVKCFLGYHDFTKVKKLSDQCDKIKCKKCQKYWAMHNGMQLLIEWDKQAESFYDMFEKL